jgi:hypothetical protein
MKDGGFNQLTGDLPNPTDPGLPGELFLHDFVSKKAYEISRMAVWRERYSFDTEGVRARQQEDVAKAAVVATTDMHNYAALERELDMALRTERRMRIYRQVLEMTTPGGALNFLEQMEPVRRRFMQDLADAFARLAKAERGLREVYGYTVPPRNLRTEFA